MRFFLLILLSSLVLAEQPGSSLTGPSSENYVLEKVLEYSEFAIIYTATRVRDGKRVAIKLPTSTSHYYSIIKTGVENFLKLNQPPLPQFAEVLDYGIFQLKDKKTLAVATELLEGPDYEGHPEKDFFLLPKDPNKALSKVHSVTKLTKSVVHTIAEVGKRGFVLGDLHLHNILLHRGEKGQLEAKFFDYDSLTRIGNARFIGVEDVRPPDTIEEPMSDVYSIGRLIENYFVSLNGESLNLFIGEPKIWNLIVQLKGFSRAATKRDVQERFEALKVFNENYNWWNSKEIKSLKPMSANKRRALSLLVKTNDCFGYLLSLVGL